MKYTHYYDFAFLVESDQEDPDKVDSTELALALLQRVSQQYEAIEKGEAGFQALVSCFDSVEN